MVDSGLWQGGGKMASRWVARASELACGCRRRAAVAARSRGSYEGGGRYARYGLLHGGVVAMVAMSAGLVVAMTTDLMAGLPDLPPSPPPPSARSGRGAVGGGLVALGVEDWGGDGCGYGCCGDRGRGCAGRKHDGLGRLAGGMVDGRIWLARQWLEEGAEASSAQRGVADGSGGQHGARKRGQQR